MTEIHLLPAGFDAAGLDRAASALTRVREAGHDLGDRGHHIRALGCAIAAAQQQLRQLLDEIRREDLADGLTEADLQRLEAFAHRIARLAALARSYEPASRTTEGMKRLALSN
ncbi:hypothetical protein [uncultured Methylobacterium sp.]|jgi:DNA repair ATPase RecN|uniref:hypothetical protein n=1 Tax=uncultured Methylobacterium sp. TaxID=157278 RepID=UPI002609D53E|nr:hypothetical protein [uncultured Methylobacterium sp.]